MCKLLNKALVMNKKIIVLPTFIVTLIIFSGCAIPPAAVTPQVETRVIVEPAPKLASELLLNYSLEARAMSAADSTVEKERARAEFGRNKSEFNRMKLAILLALSPTSSPSSAPNTAIGISEDVELSSLLEPITYGATATGNSPAPDLRALATLIQALVHDRKKLRDQLKEAQSRTQITRRDEASSQTEARILRAKVEELEKKLDALKSIERSVSTKGDARIK